MFIESLLVQAKGAFPDPKLLLTQANHKKDRKTFNHVGDSYIRGAKLHFIHLPTPKLVAGPAYDQIILHMNMYLDFSPKFSFKILHIDCVRSLLKNSAYMRHKQNIDTLHRNLHHTAMRK